MQPLYLLDASVFFFKAYFIEGPYIEDGKGNDISAVVSFAKTFLRFLVKENPEYIAAAFDESLFSGFRHELSSRYKSNRELPDAALAFQLRLAKQYIQALGIKTFSCDRYEADDYIASLSMLRKEGQDLIILSNDKDLGQLIKLNNDVLYDYSKKKKLFLSDIESKFSVKVDQISDFLALAGDSVDGISGVPGVGKKTAQCLLAHYGSIDNMLLNPDEILSLDMRAKQKTYDAIITTKDQLLVDQQLTRLYDRIEVGFKCVDRLARTSIDHVFFAQPGFELMASQLGKL